MKKTAEKKMFDELFVEAVNLENEARNVERMFELDWDYYDKEKRLIESTKVKVNKENFVDYIDWFVGAAFGLGESFLNKKFLELFDESWGGRFYHCDDHHEGLVEAIIKNVEREIYWNGWDDEALEGKINELANAWNYSLVHYRLGQSWAYDFGSHSEVEVVSELWGTGIVENGNVHDLLVSVKDYDWKKDDEEFTKLGREALENFLDDLDDDEELEWESILEDGWTNFFHVERALENDSELFMRVYNRLDVEGKETLKSDYLKKFVDVSSELA